MKDISIQTLDLADAGAETKIIGDCSDRASSNLILAVLRLIGIIAVGFGFSMILIVARLLKKDKRNRFALATFWGERMARLGCAVAGISVVRRGELPRNGVLLAPNHMSYADALVLNSILPCFFVPKSEIADWPLAGALMKVFDQPMVERRAGRGLIGVNDEIKSRLQAGQSVCVFLEGTSSGGDRVLPFSASLLQPAVDAKAPVAPVAIRWIAEDPKVVIEEDIAYWKNHRFLPHLIRFLGFRGIGVEIIFGPALQSNGVCRKEFRNALRREVAALAGLPLGHSSPIASENH